jgi:thymidylate synthase (FAD)
MDKQTCETPKKIMTTSEIKVELIQQTGGDAMVAAAARVSTSGENALKCLDLPKQELSGLINYLVKMKHGTPFEHGSQTFFVHSPIFVWREWHRHRIGFSYNEESGRYKQLDPLFYLPSRDRPMMKIDGWKPGRPKFLKCQEDSVFDELCDNLKKSYQLSYDMYEKNISLGVDPGLARDCLPVGIYSGCWVTCNPRSLMSFLSLRTYEENAKFVSYPLYEIEVAARMCEDIFAKGWPITYKAFCENGRVSP